jgi:2-polyprenyl-3-methyl-5-hydroxy-6-metoxy-1,4-benzoquinol methylase
MLLDYGAGGGSFLLDARSRGWDVRGFEPGRRGVQTCCGAGLDVTDDLSELPSGAFGVVTMHHVLEHIADPAVALRDVRRLLAPGGRLFVEVPNARSLRARLSGFRARMSGTGRSRFT